MNVEAIKKRYYSFSPFLKKNSFETEIRQRMSQKSSSKVNEEAFLLKQFKFFDMDNSGSLTKSEFKKALSKIGIIQEEEVIGLMKKIKKIFRFFSSFFLLMMSIRMDILIIKNLLAWF